MSIGKVGRPALETPTVFRGTVAKSSSSEAVRGRDLVSIRGSTGGTAPPPLTYAPGPTAVTRAPSVSNAAEPTHRSDAPGVVARHSLLEAELPP
ncbi:MAG: hypothetical protein ABMA64_43015, partial [Myxococcota bacterium]